MIGAVVPVTVIGAVPDTEVTAAEPEDALVTNPLALTVTVANVYVPGELLTVESAVTVVPALETTSPVKPGICDAWTEPVISLKPSVRNVGVPVPDVGPANTALCATLDSANDSTGVVVELATDVVNNGDRSLALNEVTVPLPPPPPDATI